MSLSSLSTFVTRIVHALLVSYNCLLHNRTPCLLTSLTTATLAGVAVRDIVTVGAVSSRLPPHLVFRTPLIVLGDLWVSRPGNKRCLGMLVEKVGQVGID